MIYHFKTTAILLAFAAFSYLAITIEWFFPALMILACVIFVYYIVYNCIKPEAPKRILTQEEIDREIWNGYDH